ncbi:low molecular weight phosphotyrosine protein phosphatase [Variovorax terrae]|nr:low molecular weight phosphotyrosine protein phosphatase [Variovorax terrae]
MQSILTVCIGNICRSPMAEGLLAAALPHMAVASAGTGALIGERADALARELMQRRGISIEDHRARQVMREMCQQADIIFVMDNEQRRYLEEKYPFTCGKVFRLCEHAKQDVPDPYRQPQAAFEQSLTLIDQGVSDWLSRIARL